MEAAADEDELAETQRFAPSSQPAPAASAAHATPRARLVSTVGAGTCHEMGGEELVLGRHAVCHVVLEDPRISARHLRIYWSGGGKPCYFLEQLGSNGSFVNDHLMKKGDTRMLQHGDIVSVCTHPRDARNMPIAIFLFVVEGREDNEAPKSRPAVALPPGAVPPRPRAPTAPPGSPARLGAAPSQVVSEKWVHDRWDLRASLGNGFFSKVHIGVQVQTGAQRAVKVVDKAKFLSFQARNGSHLQLSSEAEVLTSLEHPGIVRFHEWFQTESHFFLVMELVEGGDLLDYIMDNGCYAEPVAVRLFRELVSAIDYLHARNIVHRDLKPDNILLTVRSEDARLKIADFGLARTNMRSRDCRTFCGTPQYFAPELVNTLRDQAEGQPAGGYGKQVDMWSLGVILYVMLSGILPFDEEGGLLYQHILEGSYEFDVPQFGAVSQEAKDMVRGLMTVDPKARITVVQAAGHPWLCQAAAPGEEDARARDAPGDQPQLKRRRTAAGAAADLALPDACLKGGVLHPTAGGAVARVPSFDF